jgi:hypothetical protein
MTDKKTTDKPTAAEKTVTSKTAATKAAAASTAATEKAAASKSSDIKSAAKKISAADKKMADSAIKSKGKSDDLKTKANKAKQRAQEKILDKAFVSDKPTDPLERLADTFDSSAKRWEMVVYPSLFAFVLLAGYGFFLIYRLTHDIAVLSQSVTHMAVIVADVMPRMSDDLTKMTGSVDDMNGNIEDMTGDIGGMTSEIGSMSNQMESLTPMSKNIQSMTHNMGSMNRSVYGMQRDMHGMNRTVSSGPFGMMNDMMPFSSSTNVPRPMAAPQVWPSYNSAPKNAYSRSQPTRNQYPNTARQSNGRNSSQVEQAKKTSQDKKKVKSAATKIEAPKAIVEYKKKMKESRAAKKELMFPDARPVSLKN